MGVLMKLFSPTSVEVWRQLSDEIGAKYHEGDFWNRTRIELTRDDWTIILDTYFSAADKHEYTRLQAIFHNPDDFRFTVYRHGLFSDIAKWFGMQDVEVGHEKFDRDFIIQGTDESKLKMLFSNAKLRELVAAQPNIYFALQPESEKSNTAKPGDLDKLCFTAVGVIKDLDQLRQLFDLLTETLDQLSKIVSNDSVKN